MPRRFLIWLISPTEFRILSVVLVYEPTERFRTQGDAVNRNQDFDGNVQLR
jgi:hypothetical protein